MKTKTVKQAKQEINAKKSLKDLVLEDKRNREIGFKEYLEVGIEKFNVSLYPTVLINARETKTGIEIVAL